MKKSSLIYPSPQALIKRPIHFLAFGLGSGLLRPASGTWGSILGMLLLMPLTISLRQQALIAIALILMNFALGCYFCGKTSKDLGVHDHSGIVWDEFVGIWIVMLAAPNALYQQWGLLLTSLACCLAFRIFDILKPPPIGWLDRNTTGGFGIMIDDVLAALFSLIPLWLITLIIKG